MCVCVNGKTTTKDSRCLGLPNGIPKRLLWLFTQSIYFVCLFEDLINFDFLSKYESRLPVKHGLMRLDCNGTMWEKYIVSLD